MKQSIFLLILTGSFVSSYSAPVATPPEMRVIHTDDSSLQWSSHMEVINEDMKLFSTRPHCREACARSCKPIMLADTDQVFFICPQVKPPEKSIPERFIAKMSLPIVLLLGIVTLAAVVCFICCCRAICCQTNFRSAHSSREGLHQKHLQETMEDGNEKAGLNMIEEQQPFRSLRSAKVHEI
ncbi:hypothetical protein FO519_008881 [Halicephalobus sp. NKZ332]|nr:hypothetical protein FO519_008881 [Halicephalobus sp. NKZ332]